MSENQSESDNDKNDYEPPTSRLGAAYEVLYAGYIFVRLRLHRFVRRVGLIDEEISEKHMSYCEECGELQAWAHGTFRPADEAGLYAADAFDLECGHVDNDPGMRLTEDIVLLFLADSPEYVTVYDEEGEVVSA